MTFRSLLASTLLAFSALIFSPLQAATITLSGVTSNTCTYSSISVDSAGNMTAVCQVTAPTCSLSANTLSPTPGSTVTITLNNCPNYTGSQVTGITASATTTTTAQFIAQTAGTQYTVGLPTASGAASLNITVQSASTPPSGCALTLSPSTVSVGATVSGTISCTSGSPTSYSWAANGGAGTSTATQSGSSVSITPSASGTFSVTYSATNAAGQSSGSLTSNSVQVNAVSVPAPSGCSLSLSPSPATVGGSVTGTITCSSGNATSYSWSASGVSASPTSGQTSAVSVTPSAAGTLSITYTASNSGGTSANQTSSVTVNAATGSCPSNSFSIFNLQGQFDQLAATDSVLQANQTYVGRFVFSEPNAIGYVLSNYSVNYGSNGNVNVEKELVISKCPGSFSANDAPGGLLCRAEGPYVGVYFGRAGTAPSFYCQLTQGATYYINWRTKTGESSSYNTRFYP